MARIQGIILIPTKEDEKRIHSALESFSNHDQNLRKHVLFHQTLVIYHLDDETRDSVKEKLIKIVPQIKKVRAKVSSLKKFDTQYIGFDLECPELEKIHELIIETMQPIVEGQYHPKYLEQQLSDRQLEYLKKYGYHRIKEFFHQHMTIGKYPTQEIRDEEFKKAPVLSGTLTFDTINYDQAWEDGAPAEILWSHKL